MSFAFNASIVAGVYIFFLAFGVAQEKIYKFPDGETGETFRFFFFLVFSMCVANAIFSFSMLLASKGVFGLWKTVRSLERAAYKDIVIASITYMTSMLSSNYALTHVTYPTQVIVKSIKMVPVTVGGFLVFGKRYPLYDYVAVAVVSSALTVFNLAKGSSKSSHQTTLGVVFLFVSLACDGLTGPRQDRLLSRFPKIDSVLLMFITNIVAVLLGGVTTILFEGTAPLVFCLRNPQIVTFILAFCLSACAGQLFIFMALTNFGSLYLTLTTTTRKFFTVLLSVLMHGHRINPTQWACVFSIFSSLTAQSYFSKKDKQRKAVAASEMKAGADLVEKKA